MRKPGKHILKWLAIVVAVAVAAIILLDGTPQHVPLGSRAGVFCSVIEYQYHKLGLLPPSDMKDFYSSVLGTRFRSLSDEVKVIGGTAQDISVQSDTSDESIRLTISADIVISNDDGTQRRPFSYEHDWLRDPPEQTRRLLSTITAGTRQWKVHLPNGLTIDHAFPESKPVSMPNVGFDRPHTKKQMRKYNWWLVQMAGAKRLRDGWDRRVLLELDDSKATGPILSARSAGLDGKWQTNDDIVLRRNVDTGRIVSGQGVKAPNRTGNGPE